MAQQFPYTYIQCPCTDTSTPLRHTQHSQHSQHLHQLHPKGPSASSNTTEDYITAVEEQEEEEEEEEEDRTLDPRSARANYSLYPIEHLLYCEDCHQIRCPRCVLDEIVCWFCPNCLFEVPSSMVKSEGNRCTRNCFQCPICAGPLPVSQFESEAEGSTPGRPYVLSCAFCMWSSAEIGITFDKPNNITGQLSKLKNGGQAVSSRKERERERDRRKRAEDLGAVEEADEEEEGGGDKGAMDGSDERKHKGRIDAEEQFANLKSFYTSQLMESSSNAALGLSSDIGYGSPGALSRIMGLYTGLGSYGAKKAKGKAELMREAYGEGEGFKLLDDEEYEITEKMKELGWEGVTSIEQRSAQANGARFLSDIRPVPVLLRTKRSKRCRTCRHILVKPESKVQSTRFRIRLVALNYIPTLKLRPLHPPPTTTTTTTTATPTLHPLTPTQFVLTLHNPLFDPVRITLATPAQTPSRFSSRVTILCPAFDVGANTDVWDEALSGAASGGVGAAGAGREKKRTKAEVGEGQQQAEAGKVWERGRNWTSVVLEVVPASLSKNPLSSIFPPSLSSSSSPPQSSQLSDGPMAGKDASEHERGIEEDEDVLEIPVFVRVEYETDTAGEEEAGEAAEREKEKRELAYWCVLGLGRIAT
ncbi:MAG: hypothetical protein M1819_006172 [Sarea resinae]|nr:MAG: hypothetical protein M1819_006172 [Sarea resinae]